MNSNSKQQSVAYEDIAIKIPIYKELAGMRADVALTHIIKRMSRSKAQEILKQGVLGNNDRPIKPSTKLLAGEVLHWTRKALPEPPLPENIPILYEDQWSFVLNKPAGIPAHPTAHHFRFTLTNYLQTKFPKNRPHPAHRLDMNTSGALLCYHPPHGGYYKELFTKRQVNKTYLAICQGVPKENEFTINQPLTLDTDCDLGVRMKVDPFGQPATTKVSMLCAHDNISLLQAQPLTGRQHQIRIHLHHVGLTLIGERLYGKSDAEFRYYNHQDCSKETLCSDLLFERHALHAYQITFSRLDGLTTTVTAPLPEDMLSFAYKKFGKKLPAKLTY